MKILILACSFISSIGLATTLDCLLTGGPDSDTNSWALDNGSASSSLISGNYSSVASAKNGKIVSAYIVDHNSKTKSGFSPQENDSNTGNGLSSIQVQLVNGEKLAVLSCR